MPVDPIRAALEDAVSKCRYCDGSGLRWNKVSKAPCPACAPWRAALAAANEPIVWADDASPFTGKQVKDLLDENERLRSAAVPAGSVG